MLLVALSRIKRDWHLIRIKSIWKRLRLVFATLQRSMDSPPSVASDSDGDTNLIAPSETLEETPTGSDFSEAGEPVLEATADSSATMRPEEPSASSVAGPQINPVDEESNSHSDNALDEFNNRRSFCYNYRKSWVCQSATQTENKFTCISRASLFPESPFPHLLRLAK